MIPLQSLKFIVDNFHSGQIELVFAAESDDASVRIGVLPRVDVMGTGHATRVSRQDGRARSSATIRRDGVTPVRVHH